MADAAAAAQPPAQPASPAPRSEEPGGEARGSQKRKAEPAGKAEAGGKRRRRKKPTAAPKVEELRAALRWYQQAVPDLDGVELGLEEAPPSASGTFREGTTAEERKRLYHQHALWRACVMLRGHYYTARCRGCWLLHGFCICDRLPEVRLRARHRVFFVLNPGEFLKGTNSSKLLVRSCPSSARFLLQGVEAHEELVRGLVRDQPDRTMLLFPSRDAADLDAHLAALCRRAQGRPEPEAGSEAAAAAPTPEQLRSLPPLNIILVDGTWQQAVAMSKKPWLAGVQHVKLDFKGKSLFRDLRKRERDVGGGTVEAAIAALRALGENECADRTTDALKLLVDVMKIAKHREPVYGLFTAEQGKVADRESMAAKDKRRGQPIKE